MNVAENTPYEVLSVPRDASAQDIRRAYRKLQRVVHPDAGGNDALFRIVQAAYETLSDPSKRSAYDAGDTSVFQREQPSTGPGQRPRPAQDPRPTSEPADGVRERATFARQERERRAREQQERARRAAIYYPYGTADSNGNLASASHRLAVELAGLRGCAPGLFTDRKALRARLAEHRAQARAEARAERLPFSWKMLLISATLLLVGYAVRASGVVATWASTPDGTDVHLGPFDVGSYYAVDGGLTLHEHLSMGLGALTLAAVCWALVALRAKWGPVPTWEPIGLWALVAALFASGEHILTQPALAWLVEAVLLGYGAWWLIVWRLPRPLSPAGWRSVRVWLIEVSQDWANLLRVRLGREPGEQ